MQGGENPAGSGLIAAGFQGSSKSRIVERVLGAGAVARPLSEPALIGVEVVAMDVGSVGTGRASRRRDSRRTQLAAPGL
jgi:hypothetical protein